MKTDIEQTHLSLNTIKEIIKNDALLKQVFDNREYKLMSRKKAAQYLNMSESWLRQNKNKEGMPPYHKLGKGLNAEIKYDKYDLDLYIKKCRKNK